MYLLIDNSADTAFMRYNQKYMIFEDSEEGKNLAITEAKSRGFTCHGMENSPLKKGMGLVHMCGDKNIMILRTDITTSHDTDKLE